MSLIKLKKLWKQEHKLKKDLLLAKGDKETKIIKQLDHVKSQIKKLI